MTPLSAIVGLLLGWAGESPDSLDLQVHAVFAAKCTECHGSHLAKPKGRFGYVLDLERVGRNPDLVVPGSPEESEIYLLVSDEDESMRMPPPDARSDPLRPEEIDLVRAWIAAGAPVRSFPLTTESPVATEEATGKKNGTGPDLAWVGRFHPLTVHFPIALLIAAAVAELFALRTGRAWLREAARFSLIAGALSAVAAASLGWIAAKFGGYSAWPVDLHRWLGVGTAAFAVASAVVGERHRRKVDSGGCLARVMLLACAILVGITGHFGAVMVRGPDYFRW